MVKRGQKELLWKKPREPRAEFVRSAGEFGDSASARSIETSARYKHKLCNRSHLIALISAGGGSRREGDAAANPSLDVPRRRRWWRQHLSRYLASPLTRRAAAVTDNISRSLSLFHYEAPICYALT